MKTSAFLKTSLTTKNITTKKKTTKKQTQIVRKIIWKINE
jgi:hypothetical protein